MALIIAFPIVWWLMDKWLNSFAYRISITWWVFVYTGAVAIFIAFLTVSYHAIKRAVANPVRSLRTE